jgi:uncharacterized protein YkwD
MLVVAAPFLGAGSCGPSDSDSDTGTGPCAIAGGCPSPGGSGPDTGDANDGGGGGVVVVDPGTREPSWRAFEDDVVARVNTLRAAGGACGTGASAETFAPSSPLRVEQHLVAAARAHADDMAARGYVDHTSPDGRTPFDRMLDAGYTGFAAAENIAAGQATPAAVVEAWRTSPGHCRNLYNAALTELGVGYAFASGSPYAHYWVQNFGQR